MPQEIHSVVDGTDDRDHKLTDDDVERAGIEPWGLSGCEVGLLETQPVGRSIGW